MRLGSSQWPTSANVPTSWPATDAGVTGRGRMTAATGVVRAAMRSLGRSVRGTAIARSPLGRVGARTISRSPLGRVAWRTIARSPLGRVGSRTIARSPLGRVGSRTIARSPLGSFASFASRGGSRGASRVVIAGPPGRR